MSDSPSTERTSVPLSTRREALKRPRNPAGCAALVLTETAVAQRPDLLSEALRRRFDHRWRYVLVAVPDLQRFIDEPITPSPLHYELAAAQEHFHAHNFLVVAKTAKAEEVAQAVRRFLPGRSARDTNAAAVEAQQLTTRERLLAPSTLVITDSDWRLHDNGGIIEREVKRLFNRRSHVGVLAGKEAVKALAYGGTLAAPLLHQIAAQNRLTGGLRRVVLLGMADDASRPKVGSGEYLAAPTLMPKASDVIRKAFPTVRLQLATAFVDDTKITGMVKSYI